jgi:hypothetical protein
LLNGTYHIPAMPERRYGCPRRRAALRLVHG